MEYILCLNSGSTTLKFNLFSCESLKSHCHGVISYGKKVNAKISSYTKEGDLRTIELDENDLKNSRGPAEATDYIIRCLVEGNPTWGVGVRVTLDDIKVVCHRVVHGGEMYVKPMFLDKKILDNIDHLSSLAPLHNPANVQCIKSAALLLDRADHIAFFDSAFHASLPPRTFLYAIPISHYENEKIRKFGFHGLSHKFVSQAAAEVLGRPFERCKFITLHLGGGCSAAAISNAVSVDTTMGFTPLEGLMMATRSGDIDAGVVLHLAEKYGLEKTEHELNYCSGLLGIAGSSDFQRVMREAAKGDTKASLALNMFVDRLVKVIGAYWVALGGADAVVFTGGIGENSAELRALVAHYLDCLGGVLDKEANSENRAVISDSTSRFAMIVIKTNEELEMARQARITIEESVVKG